MKRLVFCFDGTTNRVSDRFPTNVVKTAQSLSPVAEDGTAQLIYYDQGVGTDEGESVRGGAFGYGLDRNLVEAYLFLVFNYTVGDELYVFGFSRGAYTARSFVGMLRNCGILRRRDAGMAPQALEFYRSRDELDQPDSEKMLNFRKDHSPLVCLDEREDEWRSMNVPGYTRGDCPLLKITYLGVWDTVGALGIPAHLKISSLTKGRYQFHDTELSTMVESARHALAIDEHRRAFEPTPWDKIDVLNRERGFAPEAGDAPYQQQWFPGDHGSVGGGGDLTGLSDQALDWVLDGARLAGLEIDRASSSRIYELHPDYTEQLTNGTQKQFPTWRERLRDFFWQKAAHADRAPGPTELYQVNTSAKRRWLESPESLKDGKLYRPKTLDGVAEKLNALRPEDFGIGPAYRARMNPDQYLRYTVRYGENLTRIAHAFYGDAGKYMVIAEANRDKIEDPNVIFTGQSLRIPKEGLVDGHPPASEAQSGS